MLYTEGRTLVIVPCHNDGVALDGVLRHLAEVTSAPCLVVDDGSSDTTPAVARRHGALLLRHEVCQGYGAALISGFRYACEHDFVACVTLDADGQHDPKVLPSLLGLLEQVDIVSGTRYHEGSRVEGVPPAERRALNLELTTTLNQRFGWHLTDAFCGYKAYRVEALRKLHLDEPGYGFPLQFWVQAWGAGLTVVEFPVPRIYLDANRSFGADLDDVERRRRHYLAILERELQSVQAAMAAQPS